MEYYNGTKDGVDILDQEAHLYTTKVSGWRWPLQDFYNTLDFAAINAVVVYNEVFRRAISRCDFAVTHWGLHEEANKYDDAEDVLEDI